MNGKLHIFNSPFLRPQKPSPTNPEAINRYPYPQMPPQIQPPMQNKPQIHPNVPMPVISMGNQEPGQMHAMSQQAQHNNNPHHPMNPNLIRYLNNFNFSKTFLNKTILYRPSVPGLNPNAPFNKMTPTPDQNQNVNNNNLASAKTSSRGSNASGGNVSQGGASNQGSSKAEQRLTHEQVRL
jgi:hypothetical protein